MSPDIVYSAPGVPTKRIRPVSGERTAVTAMASSSSRIYLPALSAYVMLFKSRVTVVDGAADGFTK